MDSAATLDPIREKSSVTQKTLVKELLNVRGRRHAYMADDLACSTLTEVKCSEVLL